MRDFPGGKQEWLAAGLPTEGLSRRHRTCTTSSPPANASSAEELDVTLEELRVAEEELRAQNEEIALAHEAAETEHRRYPDLFEFESATKR